MPHFCMVFPEFPGVLHIMCYDQSINKFGRKKGECIMMKKNAVCVGVLMALVMVLSLSCNDHGSSGETPCPQAKLWVYVDTSCSGFGVVPVQVYVDGGLITVNGYGKDGGKILTLCSGDHSVSAEGNNGYSWSAQSIHVSEGVTYTYGFTCATSKQGGIQVSN
jgi:hypothetical protein